MVRIKITSGGDKCEQEEMWARRKPSKQSPAVGAGSGRLGSAGRRQSGGLLCKKLTTIFFAQLFPYRSLAFLGHRKTVFLCLVLFCVRVRACERDWERKGERERERGSEIGRKAIQVYWERHGRYRFSSFPPTLAVVMSQIFSPSHRERSKRKEKEEEKTFCCNFFCRKRFFSSPDKFPSCCPIRIVHCSGSIRVKNFLCSHSFQITVLTKKFPKVSVFFWAGHKKWLLWECACVRAREREMGQLW